MTTSLYAKLSLVIAAAVLLVGATAASDYLGKNKGQFAAVGTPTCYNDAQIAALNTEKAAIEANIVSTTVAYNASVSEITRLTALLTPQATIDAKYNEAMAYKAYVIPYNKKNYPRVFWSYFNKYTPAINSYNAMVANNATYSAQITTQTNSKATYTAGITSLNAELTAKNAEITIANSKKCGTTTGGGGNTTKTTFIPVPSRFDGQCGITLTDGIEGPNCADADCFTEGSCSEGPGNPSCTTSSQCSSGEVCNGSICIPVQPDGGPCMSNDQCNSGSCAAGNCEPEEGKIGCDEPYPFWDYYGNKGPLYKEGYTMNLCASYIGSGKQNWTEETCISNPGAYPSTYSCSYFYVKDGTDCTYGYNPSLCKNGQECSYVTRTCQDAEFHGCARALPSGRTNVCQGFVTGGPEDKEWNEVIKSDKCGQDLVSLSCTYYTY